MTTAPEGHQAQLLLDLGSKQVTQPHYHGVPCNFTFKSSIWATMGTEEHRSLSLQIWGLKRWLALPKVGLASNYCFKSFCHNKWQILGPHTCGVRGSMGLTPPWGTPPCKLHQYLSGSSDLYRKHRHTHCPLYHRIYFHIYFSLTGQVASIGFVYFLLVKANKKTILNSN